MKIFIFLNLFQFVISLDCDNLLIGQFRCDEAEINPETQAESGCRPDKTVGVKCELANGIWCNQALEDRNRTIFYKTIGCRYVNGKSFSTALLLSIFLGMFGVDRFYLGYPAIGLLKLCTLGFFMIFQFIDVLLIATQTLQPADNSDYYIDYFGHLLSKISQNNETYWLPS